MAEEELDLNGRLGGPVLAERLHPEAADLRRGRSVELDPGRGRGDVVPATPRRCGRRRRGAMRPGCRRLRELDGRLHFGPMEPLELPLRSAPRGRSGWALVLRPPAGRDGVGVGRHDKEVAPISRAMSARPGPCRRRLDAVDFPSARTSSGCAPSGADHDATFSRSQRTGASGRSSSALATGDPAHPAASGAIVTLYRRRGGRPLPGVNGRWLVGLSAAGPRVDLRHRESVAKG